MFSSWSFCILKAEEQGLEEEQKSQKPDLARGSFHVGVKTNYEMRPNGLEFGVLITGSNLWIAL